LSENDPSDDPKNSSQSVVEKLRSFPSRAPKAALNMDCFFEEEPFTQTLGDSNKNEAVLTSIDILDENLSRFKEVEELYSEIMKSVDQSTADKEDGIEFVLACPAAPSDQTIEGFNSYNGKLSLRKPLRQKSALTEQELERLKRRDADGIPIAGSNFQIVMRPIKSKIAADAFRKNRKWAMKRTQSSRYHFKYNYGGYIPARSLKRKDYLSFVSAEDYDDFLGETFSDFLPVMVYQNRRREELERALEDEKKELQMQIEDTKVVEKILEQEKNRIQELFASRPTEWNPLVLDYIEDLRDPPEGSYLPENRKGLRPMIVRIGCY
jgi:hypothetical protein